MRRLISLGAVTAALILPVGIAATPARRQPHRNGTTIAKLRQCNCPEHPRQRQLGSRFGVQPHGRAGTV
jgi:hypothetical protein